MKPETELRKQPIVMHLKGWKKSQIARKLQRSLSWVERWISRYGSNEPLVSLQNHSRAPRHRRGTYR